MEKKQPKTFASKWGKETAMGGSAAGAPPTSSWTWAGRVLPVVDVDCRAAPVDALPCDLPRSSQASTTAVTDHRLQVPGRNVTPSLRQAGRQAGRQERKQAGTKASRDPTGVLELALYSCFMLKLRSILALNVFFLN